jgi:hypothetical protein
MFSKERTQKILAWFFIFAGIIVIPILFVSPAFPNSILGFVILIVLSWPAIFFLEWLGDTVLSNYFFQRLSSPKRILIAIPVVIALWLAAFGLIKLITWFSV